MKKTIAFLLTLTLLVSLCACGSKTEVVTEGSPLTLNGDKIYPIQCEDTLQYWTNLQPSLQTRYENLGDTPYGKGLEERTGVKIEYIHPQPGQEAEQFQIMLASDDLPDMVKYQWNTFPGGPQAAIDDEYIYNLNDIIDEWAPALKKTLESNDFWNKSAKNDDGNYYSFPMISEEGILQTVYGIIIREDWLEKANLQFPETISEWDKVLTTFKNDLGARAPMAINPKTLVASFGPAYNVYTDWYLNGDKVVYGAMEPGYKEVLAQLKDWYDRGLIDPDFTSLQSKVINAQLLNGETGVIAGYAGGNIGDFLQANADVEGFSITGAKFPTPEKGTIPEYGRTASTISMSHGTGISKNCKNVELAARFLDYGYTEEGHEYLNFGIEGESFNWVDRDGVKYPEYTKFITDNEDDLTMTEAMDMYVQAGYSGCFVQDTRYIEQYYRRPQQKMAQENWAQTNMQKHLLPEVYIAQEKADADADIMAAVSTYVDEMTVKFITGRESLDNYDKFIEQLKTFGIEEAIANRQEAYGKYLKR